MSELIKATLFLAMLFNAAPLLGAQSPAQPTGSITGRVVVEGKPVSGVAVVLRPTGGGGAAAKTSTDAEGRFRFSNVAPARYTLTPQAPAYIAESASGPAREGRFVVVAAGETLDGIDFSLVRGGVITGVVESEGQPLIGVRVSLARIDETSQRLVTFTNSVSSFETDDRGVYRIFGLPPGRYKVSAGQGAQSGVVAARGRRSFYPRTFSPNVTDETRAAIVEVAAGSETAGVNIQIGPPLQTYTARGRIVDAQTGQPLPDAAFSYAAMRADGRTPGGIGRGLRSDARGEFSIENLPPGRYVVLISSEGQQDFYSDAVAFNIDGSDVSNIELKRKRGASVSGSLVIEGRNDPALLARLSQVPIGTFLFQPELNSQGMLLSKIAADGSFRIEGLRPGKLRTVPNSRRLPKGFMLLRLERNGSPVNDAIDIVPGEQVTGVRVVVAYGSGGVRGQVNVSGGELPAGTRLAVLLRRVGSSGATSSQTTQVDARGLFLFEDLVAGDYELILGGAPVMTPGGVAPSRIPVVRRPVSVTDNTVADVTLTLNLTPNGASTGQ
jgi:hypothetical protein